MRAWGARIPRLDLAPIDRRQLTILTGQNLFEFGHKSFSGLYKNQKKHEGETLC